MGLVAVTGSRGDVAVSTDILLTPIIPLYIRMYVIMNAIESIISMYVNRWQRALCSCAIVLFRNMYYMYVCVCSNFIYLHTYVTHI